MLLLTLLPLGYRRGRLPLLLLLCPEVLKLLLLSSQRELLSRFAVSWVFSSIWLVPDAALRSLFSKLTLFLCCRVSLP
jgi:hypothetical protein